MDLPTRENTLPEMYCFVQPNNAQEARGTNAITHCFVGYRSVARIVEHRYPFELVWSKEINVTGFTLWRRSAGQPGLT